MADAPKNENTLHVISHTHWDREWRLTFEQFRMKLLDCLDHLLDLMETDPGYKYFTLDGQLSLLDDYLEIRPENRPRLEKLIIEGRLLLGPWYTLIDENLIWGESIVRNLLMGHREAQDWGVEAQKVGYGISSFGHINQIPQIFSGFEIDNFIFSRGISQWQTKTEFTWQAPDGSKVLGIHLPDNYTKSNWFYVIYRPHIANVPATMWRYNWGTLGLPFHAGDPDSIMTNYRLLEPDLSLGQADHAASPEAKRRLLESNEELKETFHKAVKQLEKECAEDSLIDALLGMDGVDHLEPNPWLPQIIEMVNEREGRELARHSTLPQYLDAVREKVKALDLQSFCQEMRGTTREGVHNGLFGYVMSARMDLKLENQRNQTALVRWAEPMNCLSWLEGLAWPQALLCKAWKLSMENHAHDSIGGCSIDKVHSENLARFEKSSQIADELTQRAFWHLIPQIDNSSLAEDEMAITVFNSLPYSRSDMVEAYIDIPEAWNADRLQISDLDGHILPYQKLNREKALAEMVQPMSCQVSILMDRHHVRFPAADLPGCGWETFIVKPLGKTLRPQRWTGSLSPIPNMMENEFLSVLIEADGTLRIYDKETGQEYAGLNYFEDEGEAGDAWQHVPPIHNDIYTTWMNYSAVKSIAKKFDGQLFCTYQIEQELELPDGIFPRKEPIVTEEGVPETPRRSPLTNLVKISTEVTLSAGSRRIDVETAIDNNCRDHRLRVCFPTMRASDIHQAAVPFDVIERSTVLPDTTDWKEPAYAEHPNVGFVNVEDDDGGLAIITNGIPEYSVKDDADCTICLTILRAVGRSTGEDWNPVASQLLGKNTFRYGLLPHKGDWTESDLIRESLAMGTGLRVTQSIKHKGTLPQKASLVEIKPAQLSFDGIKKADKRESLILRFHNPTPNDISAKIKVGIGTLKEAWQTNFLEERSEGIEVKEDNVIEVPATAHKVITLELVVKK